LLVMTISDQVACAGTDLDPYRSGIVVIVNAGITAVDVAIPHTAAGDTFVIPAALASDPLLGSRADWNATTPGKFHVSARTTAVFERPQAEAAGVDCNTR
jgi:hypothetical protein